MEAQTQVEEKPIRERICEAMDKMDEVRREYFQGRADYEQAAAAATAVLQLRIEAENRPGFKPRKRTVVNARSIASLIRGN
jgi:hypothetical protein